MHIIKIFDVAKIGEILIKFICMHAEYIGHTIHDIVVYNMLYLIFVGYIIYGVSIINN